MNRKILAFMTGLLTVLCIAIGIYANDLEDPPYERVSPDDIWFTISHRGLEEHIRAWESPDHTYYVFLPSYMTSKGLRFDEDNTKKLKLNGQVLSPTMDLSQIRCNKQYDLLVDGKRTKMEFRKSEEVATMFLSAETDAYLQVEDRDEEEDVLVSLIDKKGERNLPGMTAKIRGRGNSTWLAKKKPYRLTFTEETSVLEMGKAKTWLLLANAYDATNVKNKLVFDMAQMLFDDWSPDGKFVDVYYNGEYRGLYFLTERVEVDTSRVDKNVNCLLTQETIGRARNIGQKYAVEKWLEATNQSKLTKEDADFLGVVNLDADDEEMPAETNDVPEPVESEETPVAEAPAETNDVPEPIEAEEASQETESEESDGARASVEAELSQTKAVTETAALRNPYTGDLPLKEIVKKMPRGSLQLTKDDPVVCFDIVKNPVIARETNRYITNRRLGVEIVYPEKLNDDEYEKIVEQVQKMENRLFVGGKSWSKVIDKESWAKRYLIDEFSGNFDGDKLSSYFYGKEKNGKQKFFAGPVWDYDKAFMQEEADGGAYLFSAAADWRRRNVWTPYYKRLLGKDEFRECVAKIYKKEMRPKLLELKDKRFDKLRNKIKAASKNNEIRWGIFVPPVGYTNQSGEAAMDSLEEYLKAKTALMDDKWITGHEYVTVAIEAQRGGKMLEYEVRKGNLFTQFPDAAYYQISNPAWYERVTKKKYTKPFAPEEDIVLWLGRQEPPTEQEPLTEQEPPTEQEPLTEQ